MSLERRPEEQALDRLILEVRNEAAPELDWERLEMRLLREPKPAARSAALAFFERLRWPAAGLVAAAAVASVVMMQKPLPSPSAKATAKVSSTPLNGDQLALGTRVTAGNQPLLIEHGGRARWTLEPHAAASVIEAGEFLTVRLDSGALTANVVPNPKPETFAVEAGQTRVAVHGTTFRVERSGERVLVSVTEGTVAVEPSGSRSAPSFLLRRDSRGTFALDGRTGSVEGNASAVVAESGARSHREVGHAARSTAARPALSSQSPTTDEVTAAPAPTPSAQSDALQPSISNIESGVSSALELMNRCFRDKTRSTGVIVSASTGLTLSISAEGSVQSVTFAPPLAPAVEDCAVNGLRTLTFARSVEGVTFTRILELSR